MGVLIGALYWVFPWVNERAKQGETGLSAPVWVLIDFIFPILLFAPHVYLCLLLPLAWSSWRIVARWKELLPNRSAMLCMAGVAIFSSLAALVLTKDLAISGFILLTRPALCNTTTFEESASPNGRYHASVVEVDCGAMSGFNRQILLTRWPFYWAPTSILYFNDNPSLHLSWSGRTLLITGNRSLKSMDREPPNPMIWGGVIAKYIEAPNEIAPN